MEIDESRYFDTAAIDPSYGSTVSCGGKTTLRAASSAPSWVLKESSLRWELEMEQQPWYTASLFQPRGIQDPVEGALRMIYFCQVLFVSEKRHNVRSPDELCMQQVVAHTHTCCRRESAVPMCSNGQITTAHSISIDAVDSSTACPG